MSRHRSVAALGLAALLGGLALPLLGLFSADGPVPFCCRGRCCCTGQATDEGDGRPCLRQRCGCGPGAAGVITAPLQVEAVLPDARPLVAVPSSGVRGEAPREPPRPRADQPPVPPPRRPLPA